MLYNTFSNYLEAFIYPIKTQTLDACTYMKVRDAADHQPAPTSALEAGANIVSKEAEVATCPVDFHVRVRGCGGRVMSTC